MSGYLARLASRAVGDSATARPRVPARFEGYAAPLAEPDIEDAGDQRARPTLAPMASTETVEVTRESAASEPAARHARQVVEPAAVAAPRHAIGSPPPEPSGPEPTRMVGPPPGHSAALLNVPAAPASEGQQASAPAARAAAATYPQRAEPVPTPVVPAFPSPAALPLEIPATAEPETVVQITIGRVEVRAAVPSPATEPKKPAKATGPEPLALDDYLRGRRDAR